MKKKIEVMLVEDHPEYREVVNLALQKDPEIELIGEFGTAERALRSLQTLSTRREPDIILLDLNLPGMSGLEAIPFFASALPAARIIVLTQSDAEADVMNAIMHGAAGYLLKASTVQQIKDGIHTVVQGGAPIDGKVAKYILQLIKSNPPKNEEVQLLSERETEVLTLLAEGLAKKEIADRLGIGTSTIVTHVNHIYEKLNVVNAPSAVNKAHLMGILSKNGRKDR